MTASRRPLARSHEQPLLGLIVKACASARAMGAEGTYQASDISVPANDYMQKGLLAIPR